MKKFLATLMVLALVLSMSITAFAAETGSITITNATVDETYAVYKIFDASISQNAAGETEAVSYSIETDNQFFAPLFGADGKTENTYFEYNANTGSVSKKKGVNDAELIDYLTKLIKDGSYTAVAETVAASKEVKFENLPYGYYVITSTLGTAVTINSNTPDVQVIDKNQEPGKDFDKQINTANDEDGNVTAWGDANTANIGDKVNYRVTFEATNYDGDKQIKYYSINDEKGDAIWVDFDSFKVVVNGVELKRGYYLCQGNPDELNTGDWEFLGDWEGQTKDRDNAEWYLVHLGFDQFRVSIPWLEGHSVKTTTTATNTTYSLEFPENAASKFASPVDVEVYYDAVIEANASIGATTHGNRFNKAYATWTSAFETGSTTPEEVVTHVYGIGLLKDDIATGVNLAGAKFEIYKDADCTIPVYVIPTDVAGVYIVDSKGMAIESVKGEDKEPTRKTFAAYLDAYLGEKTQANYVVSQKNGKLAILGLEAGTYYLKEVEAPSGYNALTQAIEIKAGENIRPFSIFADDNGNVADIQTEDGVHKEYKLDLTHTVVHNSKGVVLPSTGGTGTIWLISIGTALAIGFAVFLITHKKMSIYTD